jgi:hypothetical protein
MYLLLIFFWVQISFVSCYLVFSPYCIRLCSPPPVESRATLGQAPLQRGCCLIYTRNTHRGEILMCLLEVGWFVLEHCRATNLFWVAIKSRTTTTKQIDGRKEIEKKRNVVFVQQIQHFLRTTVLTKKFKSRVLSSWRQNSEVWNQVAPILFQDSNVTESRRTEIGESRLFCEILIFKFFSLSRYLADDHMLTTFPPVTSSVLTLLLSWRPRRRPNPNIRGCNCTFTWGKGRVFSYHGGIGPTSVRYYDGGPGKSVVL